MKKKKRKKKNKHNYPVGPARDFLPPVHLRRNRRRSSNAMIDPTDDGTKDIADLTGDLIRGPVDCESSGGRRS